MKIDFSIVWKGVVIIFAAGVLYAQVFAIRHDLERIETKVEKHNNFDRRNIKLETMLEVYGVKEAK